MLSSCSAVVQPAAAARCRHRLPPAGPLAPAPAAALLNRQRAAAGWVQAGRSSSSSGRPSQGVRVMALDAAFPFDREAQLRKQHTQQSRLRIGIVGFGTFGQFLARRMVQAGHEVIATSRSPYHDVAASMGVKYFTDADDFCEEHPEVVILASSILSLESVLAALPVQRLKRSTLFVDVLSVKEFPKRLLLRSLPPEVDILCTHPMFGPDSGKGAWTGLNMQYERVRIAADPERQRRCDAFLQFFEREGCNMVEMSCEEHDQLAASTQFITHTVGRMLGAMQLHATPIDTRGFQSLLSLVDNTANDSFDLYYGLFMYNQNATEQLDRLEKAFDEVKARLMQQLHDKVRQQIFHGEFYSAGQAPPPQPLMLADKSSGSNGSAAGGSGAAGAAGGNGSSGAGEQAPLQAAPVLPPAPEGRPVGQGHKNSGTAAFTMSADSP